MSVVCVCVCVCVWDEYGVQAIYITIKCVTFMHIYMRCENSDSVRNKNPKSLQVVLCVCAHVCMCVHSCTCTLCKNSACGTSPVSVCVCACVCIHSCTCTLCNDSVGIKNPKSLQVVQAQSVCVCTCMHMYTVWDK